MRSLLFTAQFRRASLIAVLLATSACGPGVTRPLVVPSRYAIPLRCDEAALEKGSLVRIVERTGEVMIGRLDHINCDGEGILVVDVNVRTGRDSTAVLDLPSLSSIEVLEADSNDEGEAIGTVLISAIVSVLLMGALLGNSLGS